MMSRMVSKVQIWLVAACGAALISLAATPEAVAQGNAAIHPDPQSAKNTPLATESPSRSVSGPATLYGLPKLPGAGGLFRGSRVTIPPSPWARPRGLPAGSALSGADREVTGFARITRVRAFRSMQEDPPGTLSANNAAATDSLPLPIRPVVDNDAPDEPLRPLSEILSERIAGLWRSRLDNGWFYIKDGDYMRAHASFKSAGTLKRGDTEALFGQFVAAVAQRQYHRAVNTLNRLLASEMDISRSGPGLFEHDRVFTTAFPSTEDLESLMTHLSAVTAASDGPDIPAIRCVMLWYSGKDLSRIESTALASRIQRVFPLSPWTAFRDMIDLATSRDAVSTGGPTN